VRTPPSTNKFLIALQYWQGDKEIANKLARLIADLEPEMCNYADFLFVCRFDCSHDDSTVKYVARKFKTFTHISKRRGTGWPAGCNGTFFGTMEWFYHKKNLKQVLPYKSVLLIEADDVPLQLGWIKRMSETWDRASATGKVCVAGPWLENGPVPDCGHINGNCFITGDLNFLKWLVTRVSDVNIGVGWDYILAPQFKERGWLNLPEIKSVWRQPITEQIFIDQINQGETVLWHGSKGDTGIKLARKFLLGQSL
jgi:hypothetical protein